MDIAHTDATIPFRRRLLRISDRSQIPLLDRDTLKPRFPRLSVRHGALNSPHDPDYAVALTSPGSVDEAETARLRAMR